MAVIEMDSVGSFKKIMDKLTKKKYRLFISPSEAILRPFVSSRNTDTYYLAGISEKEKKDIEQLWGTEIIYIKSVFWDETRKFG